MMYIYKFRLSFDEVEDFVRDYEILSNQTFLDLHNIIIKSMQNLSSKELASFYIADHRWEKRMEITLMDMMDDDMQSPDDMPKAVMADAVLSDYIDDPHQKLIYEYDFFNMKTFYLELLKTSKSDDASVSKSYPKCTHSEGEIPKSFKELTPEELLRLEEYEGDDDDFGGDDGYDPEDLEDFHDDFEI